jgi:serine/threonine-protein kinase
MAREAMDQAVRTAPDTPESMRAVADYSYYCLGDFRQAEQQYRAIILRQPNYSDAYQMLAAVCRRQGKWLEGFAALRKVMELDPGNLSTARRLSGALEGARLYPEARRLRQRLLHAQPESLAARYLLARVTFLETGSVAEISAVFENLGLEQNPAANSVRRRWAFLSGNLDELLMLENERHELGLADEDPELLGSFAGVGSAPMAAPIALSAKGRKMEAEARLTRVADLRAQVEAQPENVFRRVDLAVFETLLGHKEAALGHIRRAMEGRKSIDFEATVNLNLAFVLAWTGDPDAAIAEYARLLRHPAGLLNIHEMKRDPRYQPLRGDPRFEALLADPKNNQPLL